MFQDNIREFQKELPKFVFYDSKTGRFGDTGNIITVLLEYLLALAAIILLLNLLSGGFTLMLSKGDPKAIESGKTKITNALVGFVIIFIAFWLVQLAGLVFGVQQINNTFTP